MTKGKEDPRWNGNARCQLCHYSKVHGYPTLQEERAWLAY